MGGEASDQQQERAGARVTQEPRWSYQPGQNRTGMVHLYAGSQSGPLYTRCINWHTASDVRLLAEVPPEGLRWCPWCLSWLGDTAVTFEHGPGMPLDESLPVPKALANPLGIAPRRRNIVDTGVTP